MKSFIAIIIVAALYLSTPGKAVAEEAVTMPDYTTGEVIEYIPGKSITLRGDDGLRSFSISSEAVGNLEITEGSSVGIESSGDSVTYIYVLEGEPVDYESDEGDEGGYISDDVDAPTGVEVPAK